jgi:ATP-binding cassette subfamily F protein uup
MAQYWITLDRFSSMPIVSWTMKMQPEKTIVVVHGDGVDSTAKKETYKEDKEIRNERRNAMRDMKKEMKNIENALEKLKPNATDIQNEIDNSSDEGWTVLAELTETLDVVNEQIDEKELRWLELAEALEEAAAEELV